MMLNNCCLSMAKVAGIHISGTAHVTDSCGISNSVLKKPKPLKSLAEFFRSVYE